MPCKTNLLGVKGVGELGTIGATPATVHAVLDALAERGIDHLDMPLTPERVWTAIRDARAGNPPAAWREPPSRYDELLPPLPEESTEIEEAPNL